MAKYEDMFDVSASDIKGQEYVADQFLYKPKVDDGRNGVYASIIRFLPWWKNPRESVMKKWTVFLEDPVSGKKRSVDCPSTINERSVLREMYFKLYKSNSVREKELADKFKRKQQCYSPVYIIEDKNRPELEGKVMIFSYGTKILDKLKNEMEPPIGKPRKPFDPYIGRPMSLVVTKKGGYANYDDSQFLDEAWPLVVNGETIDRESTDPNSILEWLTENTPDVEKYAYKPWDQQMSEFVQETIRNIVPNGKIIEEALGSSGKASASRPVKSSSSDADIDDAANESRASKNSGASKASKPQATKPAAVDIEEDISSSKSDDNITFDDDDDDFYAGLED